VDLMLEVEKLRNEGTHEFRVRADSVLRSLAAPPPPTGPHKLRFEFDKFLWVGRLEAPDRLPAEPLELDLYEENLHLPLRLQLMARELRAEAVRLERWAMPTDKQGRTRPRGVADQVVMPDPVWGRLAGRLGLRPSATDYWEARTWQTVWLHNSGDQPVPLFVTCEILDPATGRPAGFFVSPKVQATGGTSVVRGMVRVPPGATAPCVLPVFVRDDTPAGTWIRRLTVTPVGSDRVLLRRDRPLGVVRGRPFFSLWVLGVVVLSLAWAAAAVLLYGRAVRSFGVRVVVLLSLLGSLQFCIHFIGGLASSVLYAVLGPFNCLVGGLITEVLTYTLIAATLMLVPRVGAMTLAGLVTYLMGGILFGSFGVTDVLYVGSAIAFREIALYVFGVTSLSAHKEPPRLLPMMLALGLADAAAAYTSLALQGVLYRLFFADWYIVLQVVVTGFAYTALGVYLGRRLGGNLRRVHL
jgi:hypothetical protein